jgi:DNA polymerase-2
MAIRGFILQPTYRVERGVPVVQLYGRQEDGRPFLVRDDRQRPFFYIATADSERARGLGVEGVPCPRHTLEGKPVLRIDLRQPADAPPLRDRLHRAGIITYEADVRFARRFLIEHGIRGSVEIEGPGEDVPGFGVVYQNPELAPGDHVPELAVLSLDIETDMEARRLHSIGLYGCGAAEVLLRTPEGYSVPRGAVPFGGERELLGAFCHRVRELDPDVLTGWNVVDFDLAVLDRIARRLRLRLDLGRGGGSLRLRPSRSPRVSTEATVPGRVVLDGLDLLRGSFVKLERYSLDHVARQILGEGKLLHGSNRGFEIQRAFREDRQTFVDYNLADARLVIEILERLELVDLAVERSRLTGLPINRVAGAIAAFDFLYLSELHRRGLVAPSVRSDRTSSGNLGGHILEPVTGLYENVLVCDFQSLYPSLIRTFQIDPLGYIAFPTPGDDAIIAPNGAGFRRGRSILTGLLDELFPRRAAAKAAGNQVASHAIKILMNSFYGVLGTPACRFSRPELATAITSFGREILLWSKARFESYGLQVLYGDTDSLFLLSGEEDPEAALALGRRRVADLNRDLAEHLAATWRVESHLVLELERLYRKLHLPTVRRGRGGARKRYVGLVDGEEGEELVFTGMEVVRSDWTELAKRVQRELYRRLFAGEELQDYLSLVVRNLRSGRLDDLLVYRKGLGKPLDAYTSTTPPHVAAARKLSGKPGRTISYVMTTDGAEPAAERRSPIDHEHYVQKQIRPVAEPVLELLDLEFDRAIGDETQLRLF